MAKNPNPNDEYDYTPKITLPNDPGFVTPPGLGQDVLTTDWRAQMSAIENVNIGLARMAATYGTLNDLSGTMLQNMMRMQQISGSVADHDERRVKAAKAQSEYSAKEIKDLEKRLRQQKLVDKGRVQIPGENPTLEEVRAAAAKPADQRTNAETRVLDKVQGALARQEGKAGQAAERFTGAMNQNAKAQRTAGYMQRAMHNPLGALLPSGLGLLGELGVFGLALQEGIPVLQSVFHQTVGQYNQTRGLGQITGGGFQRGVGARLQGLRLGLNPFDMISMGEARQIVQGGAERGFQGEQLNQVTSGVAGVVNQLGIDIPQALDIMTESVRRGGSTISDTTAEMKRFDDAANHLGMSVSEYATSFQAIQKGFVEAGAGRSALSSTHLFLSSLPESLRRDTGAATTFLNNLLPQAAGIIGVPQQMLQTPRYIGRLPHVFQQIYTPAITNALQQFGGDPAMAAAQLSMTPIFQGLNVNQIQQIITQVQDRRGFGAQARFARALNTYSNTLQRQRPTYRNRTLGQIVDRGGLAAGVAALRGSKLLPASMRHYDNDALENTVRGLLSSNKVDRQQVLSVLGISDQELQRATFSGRGAIGQEPMSQRETARRALLQQIRPLLSKSGEFTERNFLRHIHERNFDVLGFVRGAEETRKTSVAANHKSATVNGITISMDNATRRHFNFKINQDNVAHGNVQSNQLPLGSTNPYGG